MQSYYVLADVITNGVLPICLTHDAANNEIGIMHEITALCSGELRMQIKLDYVPDVKSDCLRR